MNILIDRSNESVTFTLPDGQSIEIIMVEVYGEEVLLQNDVSAAFRILKDDLKYLEGCLY